jgi:hypothetical protein
MGKKIKNIFNYRELAFGIDGKAQRDKVSAQYREWGYEVRDQGLRDPQDKTYRVWRCTVYDHARQSTGKAQ